MCDAFTSGSVVHYIIKARVCPTTSKNTPEEDDGVVVVDKQTDDIQREVRRSEVQIYIYIYIYAYLLGFWATTKQTAIIYYSY